MMTNSKLNGYKGDLTAEKDGDSLHKSAGSNSDRDSQASIVDTRCGYTASCKPHCLQICADPKAYLFVISLCSIVQGKSSQ